MHTDPVTGHTHAANDIANVNVDVLNTTTTSTNYNTANIHHPDAHMMPLTPFSCDRSTPYHAFS